MTTNLPTLSLYSLLQEAYTHFNRALFNKALPDCVITLQRDKNTMGYFSADRWGHESGRETAHEIALNPSYFAAHNHSLVEIFQTLVHEQCHLWQHEFGQPSRNGYHNQEWAGKMESVGLQPTDTGLEGGKRTGQKMGDYPIRGGHFLVACQKWADSTGRGLPWVDRVISHTPSCQPRIPGYDHSESPLSNWLTLPVSDIAAELLQSEDASLAAKTKVKTKYRCNGCGAQVWGRSGLKLLCTPCDETLLEMAPLANLETT